MAGVAKSKSQGREEFEPEIEQGREGLEFTRAVRIEAGCGFQPLRPTILNENETLTICKLGTDVSAKVRASRSPTQSISVG
jgi:hypothetical protein